MTVHVYWAARDGLRGTAWESLTRNDLPLTRIMKMRLRNSRIQTVLLLVGAAGMLLGTHAGLGCASLFGEQAMRMADMCFIFDCQNGAFGGTIDFCSNSNGESPTFTDCPPPTGGSSGG